MEEAALHRQELDELPSEAPFFPTLVHGMRSRHNSNWKGKPIKARTYVRTECIDATKIEPYIQDGISYVLQDRATASIFLICLTSQP